MAVERFNNCQNIVALCSKRKSFYGTDAAAIRRCGTLLREFGNGEEILCRNGQALKFPMNESVTTPSSNGGAGFVCLERKGAELYPSKDQAVLFFEVPNSKSAITAIGQDRLVQAERTWAVLRDPEGHNILLLERSS